MTYQGGCMCKKVRYELVGTPVVVVNCHCSQCRRCHSADYASLAIYEPDKVVITQGQEHLFKWTTGKEDRYSCKECGAKVESVLNHLGGKRAVFLPNIDGHGPDGKIRPELKPVAHIFYTSGTVSVYDPLPKYVNLPTGFGGDGKTVESDYHDKR